MASTLLDRRTATKENALTNEERDAFLTEKRVGRLATNREDGWPHVNSYLVRVGGWPVRPSLGKSRRHLRHIAADPHVTMCVDDDPRSTDLTQSPGPSCASASPLSSRKSRRVREATRKMELRYLEGASGPELEEMLWFEGRTVRRDRAGPLARLGPGQGVASRA